MVLLPQMPRLIGFVLCAVGLFAAGWLVQGWRLLLTIGGDHLQVGFTAGPG
jgi:hypothetical protein